MVSNLTNAMSGIEGKRRLESRFQRSFRENLSPGALPQALYEPAPLALAESHRLTGKKDFFDHILRSDESYSAKWDYVRQNPVRARLVKEWSEWPFVGEVFDLEFRDDRF